jgi:hypothetical protein
MTAVNPAVSVMRVSFDDSFRVSNDAKTNEYTTYLLATKADAAYKVSLTVPELTVRAKITRDGESTYLAMTAGQRDFTIGKAVGNELSFDFAKGPITYRIDYLNQYSRII